MFFKLLRVMVFVLMMALVLNPLGVAMASTMDYVPSHDEWNMTYADLLRLYVSCINGWIDGNYADHDLFNTLLVEDFMSYDQAKTEAGFVLTDVNHDGIEDLLIVSSEDEVVGLFTMVNGRLREVIAGGYRNHCSLLNDGCFYIQGSSGYISASYSIWGLNSYGGLDYYSGCLLDGWFGTDDPQEKQWFYYDPASPLSGAEDRRISVIEAELWRDVVCSRILKVHNWISFADYEKAGCPDKLPYVPMSEL